MITDFIKHRICAQVENQLKTCGQFDPIRLLVSLGRLSRHSLALWEKGEGGRLEDHLTGEITGIVQELLAAEQCAGALGLVPLSRAKGPAAIAFSNHDIADSLNTTWKKDPEEKQMDLFFDNAGTQALSHLREALLAGAVSSAQTGLVQFESDDPNNVLLGAAAQLVDALRQISGEPELVPLQSWREAIPGPIRDSALLVLGNQSGLFLKPFWCYLAERLDKSEQLSGARHAAAHAWAAAAEWDRAIASIKDRPSWTGDEQSCRILLDCLQQTGLEAELLEVLFLSCWQYAELAENWLDHANNHDWLNRAWEKFSDLDNQLPLSDFPAWITLTQQRSRQAQPDFSITPESYRLIIDGLNVEDPMILKKALFERHRNLFEAVYRS